MKNYYLIRTIKAGSITGCMESFTDYTSTVELARNFWYSGITVDVILKCETHPRIQPEWAMLPDGTEITNVTN